MSTFLLNFSHFLMNLIFKGNAKTLRKSKIWDKLIEDVKKNNTMINLNATLLSIQESSEEFVKISSCPKIISKN